MPYFPISDDVPRSRVAVLSSLQQVTERGHFGATGFPHTDLPVCTSADDESWSK